MAKFTKLNIGEAVASSGGRVWKKLSAEEQVELVGTWLLNESLNKPTSQISLSANELTGSFTSADNGSTNTVLDDVPIFSLVLIPFDQNGYGRVMDIKGRVNEGSNKPMRNTWYHESSVTLRYETSATKVHSFTINFTNVYYSTRVRTIKISSFVECDNIRVFYDWLKANATKTA